MANRKPTAVSAEELKQLRERAKESLRAMEEAGGGVDEAPTDPTLEAAPFYFVLRNYLKQLKNVREAADMTLADLAKLTGMAPESLSRLETGTQTNPTWKTLGLYARALGCQPSLDAVPLKRPARRQPAPEPLMASSASAANIVSGIALCGGGLYPYAPSESQPLGMVTASVTTGGR